MLFTVHSMSKDDLSCLVRAGFRVGLVDRRPHVAATSSAMDGADDKRRGIAPAEIHPHAKQRVHRRAGVNSDRGQHVRIWQLDLVALARSLESKAHICRLDLSRRIDARYAFA